MTPGSCTRINVAAQLDYLEQLELWSGGVVASCQIMPEAK